MFALQLSATLVTQQNGWNTAGSLSDHLASKIHISSIFRQKTMGISNFAFRTVQVTVELRFVCNNSAFQSSLLFHLTIFLSTGDFFLL